MGKQSQNSKARLTPKSKTRFGANRPRQNRSKNAKNRHQKCKLVDSKIKNLIWSQPHPPHPRHARTPHPPGAPRPHPTPTGRPTRPPHAPARFNHCKFGRAELQKYQKIKFKFNPIVKLRYMGARFQKSTICSGRPKKSAKTAKNFAHKREQFGKKVE